MMSEGQIETRIRLLEDILRDVARGRIRVPRFQRPFVWNREQMLKLLESIAKGYPIGSLLIWQSGERFLCTDHVGPVRIDLELPPPPAEVGYLMDGHQRLTTLLGTLFATEEEINASGDSRWRVYYDLDKHEYLHTRRTPPRSFFPMWKLLDTVAFLEHQQSWYETGGPDADTRSAWARQAKELASTFRRCTLAITEIRGKELKEATEVFTLLNTSGRRMAPDQIFSALTYQEGSDAFDLSREVDRILEDRLEPENYGDLSRTAVLRALLAALEKNIYSRTVDWAELAKEERDTLPGVMQTVSTSLQRSIEFLNQRLGASSNKALPYALQLVMLSEFFRNCQSPNEEQLRQLEHWLWVSSFTGAFMVGSSSRFDEAVDAARRLGRGQPVSPAIDLEAPARPLPGDFHPRAARVRAFFLFLKSLKPHNPAQPEQEIPQQQLLRGGLADAVILFADAPKNMRYALANRLLVGVAHTQFVQGQDFFPNIEYSPHRDTFLGSHAIPIEAWQAVRRNDVTTFLEIRRSHLVEREIEFMKNKGVHTPAKAQAPVDDEDDAEDD